MPARAAVRSSVIWRARQTSRRTDAAPKRKLVTSMATALDPGRIQERARATMGKRGKKTRFVWAAWPPTSGTTEGYPWTMMERYQALSPADRKLSTVQPVLIRVAMYTA